MNIFCKTLLYFTLIITSLASFSEDAHKDEHGHEEEHKEEHKEENKKIGLGKGITAFNKEEGFKISAEAEKNFELKYIPYLTQGPVSIPKTAIFFGLEEKNIYRVRNGFLKRIDFKEIVKSANEIKIESKDLMVGDKIVATGIGFLRIVEISASGGLDAGHHH
jgi:hypothetical protein